MRQRCYRIYTMASRSVTLYIGVTDNLRRRVSQHNGYFFDGIYRTIQDRSPRLL